ncbi:MAG: hypothetical protein IKB24_04255 [Alistipes sp.]|nr:hypothetical protein [Alistipes sp.]
MMKALFAAFLVVATIACEKEPTNKPNEQEKEPTLSVEISEVSATSFSFIIEATDAQNIKYLVTEGSVAPDAEEVIAEGTTTEAGKITCSELTPDTNYAVAVVAINIKKQAYASTGAKTEAEPTPMPDVTVSLRDGSVTENTLSFFISSTEADVLKWVCIEDGSREVTAEQVLANGEDAEPNTESEVVVENLEPDTAYAIYAAATCDIEGFEPVLSEKLVIKTAEPEPVGYNLSATTTATANKSSSELDNYFIIFADEANGYTLRCDFYTAVGDYLPSGEYTLGEVADGALSKNYTTFMFTPSDSQMTTFERGSITVEATPNEETREVQYSFNGLLYFPNGDFVTIDYNGLVEGIMLPEPTPEIPDVPEGATVFTPDIEVKQPVRLHTPSLVPGEYYIKFYDSNWNELVLDIMLDPATCNDGNDALPAGRYTMEDGTIDSYSNIALYNPYFSENFTEAELVVSVEGLEYELTFIGTAGSGSTAKTFYMHYKGEIQDMVLEE